MKYFIMTLIQIEESFSVLTESIDKLEYIISLGKELIDYPGKKDDIHKITGCSANVWLDYTINNNKYTFYFDSDALIVKGLLYILKQLCDSKTKEELHVIDFIGFFEKHEILVLLSNQRQVGLQSIIKKIKDISK